MGFDRRLVSLIMCCVSTVSYKVTHVGHPMGPIIPNRGFRQGDPLSHYLFLICAEGLSSLLKIYEQNRRLTSCKVARGALVISHMLFADDSYAYCKASEEEATNVLHLLHTYEAASDQKVNFAKSLIFFSNNTQVATRSRLCELLGMVEASENSLYLGLPCIMGRNKNAILSFLKDKMKKRIFNWESHFLSKVGEWPLLDEGDDWKKLWQLAVPSKAHHFMWRATLECLPTKLAYLEYTQQCVLEEEIFFFVVEVVRSVLTVLGHWSIAQSQKLGLLLVFDSSNGSEQWRKSKVHKVKVNVDGAIFTTKHRFGFGSVARDPDGNLIEAISSSRCGSVQPKIAELIRVKEDLSWIKVTVVSNGGNQSVARDLGGNFIEAISSSRCGLVQPKIAEMIRVKEDLSWIKGKCWSDVVIESDALVVVQAVNSSIKMPSQFRMLVRDCLSLLSSLNNVSLSFVKRSTNRAAHLVARGSCFMSNYILNN
uniref:RNase H type-1 domain-containing protein n=1 Tax=Cannabis sativa TaxID=3483 RepID=A0A803NJ40_CANSA